MEFKNEETRKLFMPTVAKDQKVLQPASEKHGAYEGPLSLIPVAVAQSMYAQGCNLLNKNVATSPGKPGNGSSGEKS